MSYDPTFRQGEIKLVYGSVSYAPGSITILGTPTCTLYNSNRVVVFSNTPVTGKDKGRQTNPSAWHLIDTSTLTPGVYTLTFKINVMDSDNFTRFEEPDVHFRVASLWEDITEYVYAHPASTLLGRTNIFGSGVNRYICATKASCNTNQAAAFPGTYNSTDSNHNGTYVTSHTFVETASRINVGFLGSSLESFTGNTETLACSMRYAGINYQFTFSGLHTGTLQSGGVLVSDDLPNLSIPKWATVQFSTWTSVPVSGRWPLNAGANSLVSGEGFSTGVDLTPNLTAVSSMTLYCRCPNAIMGVPAPGHIATVALLGNSIITGQGESYYFDRGFAVYGLNNQIGYMKFSVSAENCSTFTDPVASSNRHSILAAGGFDNYIVEYCDNDLMNGGATAATCVTRLNALTSYLLSIGGIVDICTVPPRTTSGNGWIDLPGQTLHANNTERVNLNTIIRALGITGMRYCLDISSGAESSFNSGKWIPNGTPDGIHPNPTAVPLMGAYVLPSYYYP